MARQDSFGTFKVMSRTGQSRCDAPADIHPIMKRAIAELVASGQAARAIKAGDHAPQFTLKDQRGDEVSSVDLCKRGPLVVAFYRGIWCPYCNIELLAINEVLPQIRAYGAHVVAISPQTPANGRQSVRENGLSFPVLSDVNGETSAAFGLRYSLPGDLIDLYRRRRIDLPAFNDDPSWTLAMPARYVVGRDGIVLYSEVSPDFTCRCDPRDMFAVLEKAIAQM